MTNVPLHALERSIHQFPIKKITYCSKFLRLFLHENSFITIFNCFIVALNNVTISRKSQGNAAIVIIYTISASLCDFFFVTWKIACLKWNIRSNALFESWNVRTLTSSTETSSTVWLSVITLSFWKKNFNEEQKIFTRTMKSWR